MQVSVVALLSRLLLDIQNRQKRGNLTLIQPSVAFIHLKHLLWEWKAEEFLVFYRRFLGWKYLPKTRRNLDGRRHWGD